MLLGSFTHPDTGVHFEGGPLELRRGSLQSLWEGSGQLLSRRGHYSDPLFLSRGYPQYPGPPGGTLATVSALEGLSAGFGEGMLPPLPHPFA